MKIDIEKLQRLALTVRMLSVDGVEKANSGHPGMPMGSADIAAVLWTHFLRFNPSNPSWLNRDRFVLSAGHGSMLLYSLLHLWGFDLPMTELQSFRQWGSKTPGHPEFGLTSGVETTTGPLGQGFGNGVGIALSGKLLASTYDAKLFDYRVFGIVSDGDLMEGVASEAASLAGHLKLGNLIYVYDDNHISIGGDTNVCFTESVPKRFESYGWHVQSCDGHDLTAIGQCLSAAVAETSRPSIICARTTIGFGSPHKANTAEVHGSPLGKEELRATKEALGWPSDKSFWVPDDVGEFLCEVAKSKAAEEAAWNVSYQAWRNGNADRAKLLDAQLERVVPHALKEDLIRSFSDGKKDATRNLSGKALQVIAQHCPYLVGGSADLEPSTKTLIKNSKDVQAPEYSGRNIRFGVREHGMGAVANGLAYGRVWFPYTATFLVFADYMRPTVRLAALSHLQTLFIFTHDSFWVGEDGPTHEPIEHIQSLRVIPNLYVFRPCDGIETAMSYFAALTIKDRPSALLFTRQNLEPIARPSSFTPDDVMKGGYVVYGEGATEVVIVATGSEVAACVDAAKILETQGMSCRVVSMPCVELFREQSADYQSAVIPPKSRKVSVEAGSTFGWTDILGADALTIGIDHYGASAPGEVLVEKFGFTAPQLAEKIRSWM